MKNPLENLDLGTPAYDFVNALSNIHKNNKNYDVVGVFMILSRMPQRSAEIIMNFENGITDALVHKGILEVDMDKANVTFRVAEIYQEPFG